MSFILGFSAEMVEKPIHYLIFDEDFIYIAPHKAKMAAFIPRNLIICCYIMDNTIFGWEHVKLLRVVTNSIDASSDIFIFDFLQNEYVELKVKEFKSIKIGITDVNGKTIKCDSDIATRLQIMFINV